MRKLLSGVAAVALVTVVAHAQSERGERGKGPAEVERGNDRQERAERPEGEPEPDRGPEKRENDRGADRDREDRGREDRGREDRQIENRGKSEARQDGREDDRRSEDEHERADAERERPAQQSRDRESERRAENDRVRERGRDRDRNRERVRIVNRRGWDNYREVRFNRGPIAGCPPGLRKKGNGCLPPGQAKRFYETRPSYANYYSPAYFGYDGWDDGRYLYDDGYLFRLDDRWDVASFVPLLGGALSIGNSWPEYYDPAPLPDYYVDYYNLGPASDYRYADDVIYRVNPQSSSITSIAALLTGDQFAIGDPMPSGYDVYNVPYAYRDRYYDTPEANYRYADGYIYQSDPTTGLIQTAIELLL